MVARMIEKLPIPESGCGNLRMLFDGVEMLAEYEYRTAGVDTIGAIRFHGVVTFRFSDEMHCAGFVRDSYDSVVEVADSEWLRSLKDNEPPGISGVVGKTHFAMLFSSNGYLEVVAERLSVPSARIGRL